MWTPDPAKIVTAEQKAEAAAAETAKEERRLSIREDSDRTTLIERLVNATPAQINNYVDNNVTNIAQARAMFKAILKLLALDLRE